MVFIMGELNNSNNLSAQYILKIGKIGPQRKL